jgi:thiopeptide-type bacteriocin biosynthesis protein
MDVEPWIPGAPSAKPLKPLPFVSEGAAGNEVRSTGALRWIAYVPETERYGGPDAIAVAERVFEASSNLALALIGGIESAPRSVRLGKALLAFLATLHSFHRDRTAAAATARQYGQSYLRALDGEDAPATGALRLAYTSSFVRQASTLGRHVEEIWNCLDAGELPPAIDTYVCALGAERDALMALQAAGRVTTYGSPITEWRGCVARVLPSYLHMTSNRLGVTIAEESYLAYIAHWVLAGRHTMLQS